MAIIIRGPGRPQVQKIKVIIGLGKAGNELNLNPTEVALDPIQLQELHWEFIGNHNGDLIIQFPSQLNPPEFDSPFRTSRFRCPKGGGALSGCPARDKARSQPYEYTVTLTTGTTVRTAMGKVYIRNQTPSHSINDLSAGEKPV